MSDEKQEEERIQRAMNRKTNPNRSSMLVKSGNEAPPPVASAPSYSNRMSMNVKSPAVQERPKAVAQEKPKAVNFQAPSAPQNSAEIENLQLKKRTLLGTIVSTRRDLEDVRNEIAKLKSKESELVSLLEKREQSVQQLTQDIEQLEHRNSAEDSRRKEEEKTRRIKEEIASRKKEEEEEERRRIEEEEKKILNPQPVYAPRVASSENLQDDGVNAEELRLMRAMSRPQKAGGQSTMPQRTSGYRPAASAVKQIPEEERRRMAEENKRKEEENRVAQEQRLKERVAHLQHEGGIAKKFISPQVYDFDADVRFCADFTQFEDIPITTPIDNNFTHSVNWNVSPGLHFYVFKINGKAEINKNIPTGLAPNGQLMNKIDC
jgi:hypothetical protein